MNAKASTAVAEAAPVEIIAPPKVTADRQKQGAELLQKAIADEGHKMVKGIFRNYDYPGAPQTIEVRKYPEKYVRPFKMEMMDGCEYTIPLYVARHLNGIDATATAINGKLGTCSYPVMGYVNTMPNHIQAKPVDKDGNPMPNYQVDRRIRRFSFESTEFSIT